MSKSEDRLLQLARELTVQFVGLTINGQRVQAETTEQSRQENADRIVEAVRRERALFAAEVLREMAYSDVEADQLRSAMWDKAAELDANAPAASSTVRAETVPGQVVDPMRARKPCPNCECLNCNGVDCLGRAEVSAIPATGPEQTCHVCQGTANYKDMASIPILCREHWNEASAFIYAGGTSRSWLKIAGQVCKYCSRSVAACEIDPCNPSARVHSQCPTCSPDSKDRVLTRYCKNHRALTARELAAERFHFTPYQKRILRESLAQRSDWLYGKEDMAHDRRVCLGLLEKI